MATTRQTTPSIRTGFTLIELLIVIMIIGILAAMVIPALATAMEKSRQRTSMANMRGIGNQLQIYQNDQGFYPAAGGTIVDAADAMEPVSRVRIPTEDAWHNQFGYATDGLTAYSVESYGRRGLPGANITPATSYDFDLDLVLSNGQFSAAVR